jgi:hypothetical protein
MVQAAKAISTSLTAARFENERVAALGSIDLMATQTEWETSSLWSPFYTTGDPAGEATPSAANLMEIMLGEPRRTSDSGTKKNVSGRITAGLDMVCLTGALIGGTSLPTAGTYNLELTPALMSSLNSTCGTTMTLTETVPLTVVVEDVTSTNFDKKITIETGGDGGRTEYAYLRSNSSVTNIGLVEKGQDGDDSRFLRTLATIDNATGVTKVEFIHRESSGGYTNIARAYIDGTDVKVAGMFKAPSSKSLQAGINFSTSGGDASVYFDHSDMSWTDNVLCISTDTGDIADGDSVCAGRDIGSSGVWDFSAVVTAVEAITLPTAGEAIGAGGWKLSENMGIPSFTDSTIWTSSIATNP